jgi:hypothetical protein
MRINELKRTEVNSGVKFSHNREYCSLFNLAQRK